MPSAIDIGELLKDRYRLERTLGHGGMAAVWLGHDEVLDRQVAVKVLSDTIATDPGFVARFRREAQTAAGLSHPNLVGVYDYSDEGERPYLVMQFVPGETLAARLQREEGVDCDKLARELLEAVAHIHQVGILHRDIKPANIILEPDGTAKLIDFGIALPRDATALTNPGLILGTERYAAPEVMEGKPATERSDLYSAGVVLRSCGANCSRALGALIDWLTSKDPMARPATARQALVRLERAEALGQPTQVYEPTFARQSEPQPESELPPPPPPAYARTSSRGSRWGAIAAILGVIVALLVLALVVFGGGGDQRQGKATSAKQAKAKAKSGKGKQAGAGAGAGAAAVATESSEATAAESSEASEEPEVVESSEEPEAIEAPEPSGGSSESGAALNEQGYALLQAGEYEAAVPVLEEAVASFPEGSEDLNYAYALFNLGHALRLSGRPEEAVPVLEQRLQIPNQTSTVESELEAARSEAGE